VKKMDITRRNLLQFLAYSSLRFPFLPSLFSTAQAAQSVFPKRLIILFSANGQYGPDWYPRNIGPGITQVPLKGIEGPISTILGSEFDPFREKMLLLRGLDIIPEVDEHWGAKVLSGYGQSYNRKPTMDQIVCRSPSVYSSEPILRSLVSKIEGRPAADRLVGATHSYAPFGDDTVTIIPQSNPKSVFDAIFPANQDVERSLQISTHLYEQYKAISSSSRLSKEDKYKLETHMNFISEMKSRYSRAPALGCNIADELRNVGRELEVPILMKDHLDLIATAVKCDITRVVRFNLTESGEARSYHFVPGVESGDFHNYTHSFLGNNVDYYQRVQKWLAKQVAYLLEQLNQVEDPITGRTYLDNSIVYWGNESGARVNGDPNNPHDDLDLPCLLAGDGKGFLTPGKYVDYRQIGIHRRWFSTQCPDNSCINGDNHNYIGKPINELLITLMTGMGLNPSEWESSPDSPGFGDYSENFMGQYRLGDKRSLLPWIVR